MKVRGFTVALSIMLLFLVIALFFAQHFMGNEMDMARFGHFTKDICVLVHSLGQWAMDNDGKYPISLTAQGKIPDKKFIDYLEKPIEKSYLEGFSNIDSIVTFVNDKVPEKVEYGNHKPGSIYVYVFNEDKECIVIGYGYKKQPIIRSDTERFKEYYESYQKAMKHK